jgi:chromosome segregation ATPase
VSKETRPADQQQRLKGAIDTRIAEEQARQRQQAATVTPARPAQRRRPLNQNGAGSRTPSRQRDPAINADKGPDPADFEPDFAIGDDDSAVPSRVATPKPQPDQPSGDKAKDDGDNATSAHSNGSSEPTTTEPELPSDVQTKLKKLERLESKYGDLLKAYRIAHARIQVIGPFEASLREHTPLTSIEDPAAFVEYLGQVSAKSDMILDEFKRVSAERDDLKKQAEQSQDAASQLRVEVAEMKKAAEEASSTRDAHEPSGKDETATLPKPVEIPRESASPVASIKSPASTSSRIPSFSLFSPRSKPTSPPPKDSEDLFSYDSEVPKLESDLRERQQEVEQLKTQMEKLKGDLTVARESTEGMVVSLESATRELHELREAKDRFEDLKASLENRIRELETSTADDSAHSESLQVEIERLKQDKIELSQETDKLKEKIASMEKSDSDMQAKLESNQQQTAIVNEKLAQKDSIVKDLEDTLAMMKSAERQSNQAGNKETPNAKKLRTMEGVMSTLRQQLDTSEGTVSSLREEIKATQDTFASRPSSKIFGFLDNTESDDLPDLKTREDVVSYLASNFGLQKASVGTAAATKPSSIAPSEASTATAAKKKSKKKKKGKGGQSNAEEPEHEGPIKVSENLAELDEDNARAETSVTKEDLERLLDSLRTSLDADLASRDSTIEKLSKQIKDQEALQEEIETLRDDLLHQGEEHVEARDKLKTAETERLKLSEQLEELEKEMKASKEKVAAGVSDAAAQSETLRELETLKDRSSALERDLKASEQLAASRFKDLSDLKEIISKAQPELKSLRAEAAELKSTKEDLKNKEGELNRLESRHEDLKSEMKGLSKRLGDKDAETKDLQQKIEQETSKRKRLEDELRNAQSDLRVAETIRTDAVNASNDLTSEIKRAKTELSALRGRITELEDTISNNNHQITSFQEEITLKTALHTSSQALVQSLRDQTLELTTQARESSSRAENLEEELAETQRMLTERTREGQTMRMLLNQSESGTEARTREMRERMDAAIEERDRIEDEASVASRRMMRELDELRTKEREARRALKINEDEKEELEIKMRDFKRRATEQETAAEIARKEVEDMRAAMDGLREALNESERQAREMETQRQSFRRDADEAKERVEKLTRANKNLSEELKSLQSTGPLKKSVSRVGVESGVQSSRTSIDSGRTKSPAPTLQTARPGSRSETPSAGAPGAGLSQGTVDYVYLKNVLLQFLEQKDKTHQRQLVPVIGMLLKFDQYVIRVIFDRVHKLTPKQQRRAEMDECYLFSMTQSVRQLRIMATNPAATAYNSDCLVCVLAIEAILV